MNDTVVRVAGKSTRVIVNGGGARRVTLQNDVIAKINANRPRTVVQPTNAPVRVTNRNTIVRTGGGMGVQGVPGETEGATFLAVAGATIHGARAVRIENGLIYHPQLAEQSHAAQVCGLAVQSGPPGSTLLVRSGGVMEDNSWSWFAGFVYCGDDGVLTQTAPLVGWVLKIGRADTPTMIRVDIDIPFYRS